MIDRKIVALINGEVDGVNTPDQSEFLRQELGRNPEARDLLESLRTLERTLSSVPSVDPPTGLKQSIMRSIPARQVRARKPEPRVGLIGWMFPARPLPRLGFAFSGGVLAGVLLVILYFAVAAPPSIDVRDASGTLFGSSSEALQTAEDAAIGGDGVEGRIITEYSSTMSVMRVDLTMRPEVTVRFLFNPIGTELKGVTLGKEFPGTLTQSEGLLEVGEGGGRFSAFFAPEQPSAQNVRFQVISGRSMLYERSLALRKIE